MYLYTYNTCTCIVKVSKSDTSGCGCCIIKSLALAVGLSSRHTHGFLDQYSNTSYNMRLDAGSQSPKTYITVKMHIHPSCMEFFFFPIPILSPTVPLYLAVSWEKSFLFYFFSLTLCFYCNIQRRVTRRVSLSPFPIPGSHSVKAHERENLYISTQRERETSQKKEGKALVVKFYPEFSYASTIYLYALMFILFLCPSSSPYIYLLTTNYRNYSAIPIPK